MTVDWRVQPKPLTDSRLHAILRIIPPNAAIISTLRRTHWSQQTATRCPAQFKTKAGPAEPPISPTPSHHELPGRSILYKKRWISTFLWILYSPRSSYFPKNAFHRRAARANSLLPRTALLPQSNHTEPTSSNRKQCDCIKLRRATPAALEPPIGTGRKKKLKNPKYFDFCIWLLLFLC